MDQQDDVWALLKALFNLEGVCGVSLESPRVLCAEDASGPWWCHYHHHYPSGDTHDDYGSGPTALAAVQDAYADQVGRCGGRTKGQC